MRWVTLDFGKHAGKTLPEIVLSDADWVFWAFNKGVFKGRLASEAAKVVQRARSIKIPKRRPKRWQVEYSYDDTGGFCGFRFVKADSPWPYGFQARVSKSIARFSSSLFRRQHSTDQAEMQRILQQ